MPNIRQEIVPENLRDLIPLAEKWGIVADTARHRFAETASDVELEELSTKLRGRHREIEDWLYAFEINEPQPSEAAAFGAMVVAELEECNGPGLHGYLDYALLAWKESSTPTSKRRLQSAYKYTKDIAEKVGSRLFQESLDEAERILNG